MNVNSMIAQTMQEVEGVLREMAEAALLQSEGKTLTIHSMELLMTKAISRDISDPNKSGWKEIKLGVIFADKDIFNPKSESNLKSVDFSSIKPV